MGRSYKETPVQLQMCFPKNTSRDEKQHLAKQVKKDMPSMDQTAAEIHSEPESFLAIFR